MKYTLEQLFGKKNRDREWTPKGMGESAFNTGLPTLMATLASNVDNHIIAGIMFAVALSPMIWTLTIPRTVPLPPKKEKRKITATKKGLEELEKQTKEEKFDATKICLKCEEFKEDCKCKEPVIANELLSSSEQDNEKNNPQREA